MDPRFRGDDGLGGGVGNHVRLQSSWFPDASMDSRFRGNDGLGGGVGNDVRLQSSWFPDASMDSRFRGNDGLDEGAEGGGRGRAGQTKSYRREARYPTPLRHSRASGNPSRGLRCALGAGRPPPPSGMDPRLRGDDGDLWVLGFADAAMDPRLRGDDGTEGRAYGPALPMDPRRTHGPVRGDDGLGGGGGLAGAGSHPVQVPHCLQRAVIPAQAGIHTPQ
jgi:hypothetical protein